MSSRSFELSALGIFVNLPGKATQIANGWLEGHNPFPPGGTLKSPAESFDSAPIAATLAETRE